MKHKTSSQGPSIESPLHYCTGAQKDYFQVKKLIGLIGSSTSVKVNEHFQLYQQESSKSKINASPKEQQALKHYNERSGRQLIQYAAAALMRLSLIFHHSKSTKAPACLKLQRRIISKVTAVMAVTVKQPKTPHAQNMQNIINKLSLMFTAITEPENILTDGSLTPKSKIAFFFSSNAKQQTCQGKYLSAHLKNYLHI